MSLMLVVYMLMFTCVVGWLFFYTETKYWPLKFAIVGFLFIISSAIAFSFETYKGWPIDGMIFAPDNSIIVSIMVNEPEDLKHPELGSIFVTTLPCYVEKECEKSLWTTLRMEYLPDDQKTPRIYKFPYNNETREGFSKAKEQMEEGQTAFLKIKHKGNGKGDGTDETQQDSKDKGPSAGESTLNAWSDGALDIKIDIFDQSKGFMKKN